jgi:perosamine synthetase
MYYGSIGKRRALQALVDWAAGAFVPASVRRARLARIVRAHLEHGEVFALGSARSALAACLKGLGIRPGDEVLLSSYTCLAVPTAVIAAGGTPVYVDIDPRTLNADAETVIAAMSSRTRAVVVQHTLGNIASIGPIVEAAKARGLVVIEDCALAVGSRRGGQLAGALGDAAVFSMELSKTISCGWGGILVIRDPQLAEAVHAVYARLPEPARWASARDIWQTAISAWCHRPRLFHLVGKYVLFIGFRVGIFRRSTPPGEFDGWVDDRFLLRMGGAQAALAARQWRDLPAIASACEQHARSLRHVLQELGFDTPGAPGTGEVSVAPRVSFLAADRGSIMAYFFERGLELGEWFDGPLSPVPSSPLFNYQGNRYPQAARVARHVVNLPCHNRLTAADVASLAETLRDFVRDSPGCTSHPVYQSHHA